MVVLPPPATEASCVSQILTAQAVAEDMGESRAASSGVQKWASCSLTNSERDAQQTIQEQRTKLDVPISTISCNEDDVPWISPVDWVKFILKRGLWPLLAGCDRHDHDGFCRTWMSFWEKYKLVNPTFGLFDEDPGDLSRTAALFLHGDEGRTLKRGGMLITSLQSALGRGYDEKRVGQQNPDQPSKLRVNFAGHSFTTRFVVHTIPKTAYDANPELFHTAIDHVAVALRNLFSEGIVDPQTGHTFRVVLLGVKGDAPYLTKVGHFYRSYNTTAKRGQERGPPKGVCPYCLGGTDNFPCEEFTDNPKWLQTIGVKLPWVRCPSLIQRLIHDRGDPAAFFKSDIWHVVHLGFGRSWIASVIQLVLPVLDFSNLDEKWEFLSSHYLGWCHTNHRQAHICKVTAYLMSYGDSGGAMGNWHKGALTTNFFRWIVVLIGDIGGGDEGLLQCRIATYRLNAMFSLLYRAGAFLNQDEAAYVSQQGLEFLRCYAMQAQRMFTARKQWLFPLYPKLHVFHHLMLSVKFSGLKVGMAFNPMMWGCQMDEDTVGRASRLSRRVNVRQVSFRTLDRYRCAAFSAFEKAGLLIY